METFEKTSCQQCGKERGAYEELWVGVGMHEGLDSLCWECHKLLEAEEALVED